jgi:GTPase SAR1 family protein
VFENTVLRRSGEVTEEWRKLHDEELNDFTAHPILFG